MLQGSAVLFFGSSFRSFLLMFLLCFGCIGCTGIRLQDTGETGGTGVDIAIPEEMPLCSPNEQATALKPCYEGRFIKSSDGTDTIQETCGKYWDMFPNDEHKAVMERVNCCKRNNAVLLYYLKLNRDSVKYMQNLLKEGI
jgi:hypothetical protein